MSPDTLRDLPDRVIVDQHGHYWRDYGDSLSMCPVSTENNATVTEAVYLRDEIGPMTIPQLRELVWDTEDARAALRKRRGRSHVLAFPPHEDGFYASSALCSCGEFQWDAETGESVRAAEDPVRADWSEHVRAAQPPDTDNGAEALARIIHAGLWEDCGHASQPPECEDLAALALAGHGMFLADGRELAALRAVAEAAADHGICICTSLTSDGSGPRPIGESQSYHYQGCDNDDALRDALAALKEEV